METLNKITLTIAKALLKEAGSVGISKVRLAKMIYFTHKELCRKGLLGVNDIQYIRMPLGPIPQGFKDLKDNPAIRVREEKSTDLIYNRQTYFLVDSDTSILDPAVKAVFAKLEPLSTSKLVEDAHKDFSWTTLKNGENFYMSQKDLDRSLPRKAPFGGKSGVSDSQMLQSLLVKGMLEDIVEESTRLEYPHYGEDISQK